MSVRRLNRAVSTDANEQTSSNINIISSNRSSSTTERKEHATTSKASYVVKEPPAKKPNTFSVFNYGTNSAGKNGGKGSKQQEFAAVQQLTMYLTTIANLSCSNNENEK
jgi:hypothetical protein